MSEPVKRTDLAKAAIAKKQEGKPPVKRLTPEVPKPDTIIHTCGHTRTPTELKSVKCSVCMERDRVNAETRRRVQVEGRRKFKGRLPKGSTFASEWDGEKWVSTLAVKGVGHWNGEGDALFQLLAELDDQYRAAVKAKAEEVKP